MKKNKIEMSPDHEFCPSIVPAMAVSRMLGLFIVGLFFLANFSQNFALANEALTVQLTQSPLQSKTTTPVLWKSAVVQNDKLALEGVFQRPGPMNKWVVLLDEEEWKVSSDRQFKIEIPYDPDNETLELVFTSASGQVEYHFYDVKALATQSVQSQDENLEAEADKNERRFIGKSRFRIEPGFSFASVSYNQTSYAQFDSIVLNLDLWARYRLNPRWEVQSDISIAVLNIARSFNLDARYLKWRGFAGYRLTEVNAPWDVLLRAGWFYNTMLNATSVFGYQNISGPVISPTVSYQLNEASEATLDLQYGMVADRFKLLGSGNTLFGVGATYQRLIWDREVRFRLSYDSIQVNTILSVKFRTWTLGASIAF